MEKIKSWCIKESEIPEDYSIHRYIMEKTDILKYMEKVKISNAHAFGSVKLTFNINKLTDSVIEGLNQFGLHNFSYAKESTKKALTDECYQSCSLTYNPHAKDKVSPDPHRGTLGSRQLKFGSASLYEKGERHTYCDSLSFRTRTPFAEHAYIKEFLDTFERTLIRSRVSSLKGSDPNTQHIKFCWHDDESIFINLRVNIPIVSSHNFCVQVINNQNDDHSLNIEEITMEKGNAYYYDTGKVHRPFTKMKTNQERIHMVCGVSPWFDYLEDTGEWVSNEFYGRVHPFDMLIEGKISPFICNRSK